MTEQLDLCPLIIHIDDNEGDLDLAQQAVEECFGAKISYKGVAHAETALKVLSTLALPGLPPLALIIVDLNLPRISGWEIIDFIRADPVLRNAPLAILSGSTSSRDMTRARASGVAYRVKPSSFNALCAVIRNLVGTNFL